MEFTHLNGVNDYLGNHVATIVTAAKIETTLKKYEEYKENKTLFEVSFSLIDPEGNLAVEEKGVKLLLDVDDAKHTARSMGLVGTGLTLGDYRVIVKDVDHEKHIVRLACDSVKSNLRKNAMSQIDRMLREKQNVLLKGKVIDVNSETKRVIVDIGGIGIRGYIPIGLWSRETIHNIQLHAQPGDIIPITVISRGHVGGYDAYRCSRKAAVDDSVWDNIEERYPKGSIVKFQCTDISMGHHFFARIEGLDDVELFCNKPPRPEDRNGNPLDIVVGAWYQGTIVQVDATKKILRAHVLYRIKA